MSDDGFDWHASELAKTNPNVTPPELPDGHAVAGEVEGKTDAPELVEISTVRVLGDLVGTRIDAPTDAPSEVVPAAAAAPEPAPESVRARPDRGRDRRRAAPALLALALLALAAVAWALIG